MKSFFFPFAARLSAAVLFAPVFAGMSELHAAEPNTPQAPVSFSPPSLPGRGLAQHDFLYAGEWDTRKEMQSLFLVRGGKVVWSYSMPLHPAPGKNQEFDDAELLPNGNVLFSRMSGAGIVSPERKLVWDYPAPAGTEIHSAQWLGGNRVLIMRNGNPAKAIIFDTAANTVEREILIPTPITGTHGQFRHMRMTAAGTLLVPHLGEGKVVEYTLEGKPVWSVATPSPWSAVRLANGHTLVAGDHSSYVREFDSAGGVTWEFGQADVPDIKLFNLQTANRLENGNTVICNWCAGHKEMADWPQTVQILEVTPDKKVVWALRSWTGEQDLGPSSSIQILDSKEVR